MAGDVQPIRKDEPVNKVIATGFSIVVGIANDAQITFQSGYEGDEDDSSINARVDRMMRIAQRQKAIHEVADLEKEIEENRKGLTRFVDLAETAEANFAYAQAERQVQIDTIEAARPKERAKVEAEIDATILKIQERRNEEMNAGLAEHARDPRRTSAYKPKGFRLANITRCDEALEKAKEHKSLALEQFEADYDEKIAAVRKEMDRAVAERDQHNVNLQTSIRRHNEEIATCEAKLALRKPVAEG